MRLPSRSTGLTVIAAAAILSIGRSAGADFELVSQDLSINRAAAEASFTLTFNEPPNFSTLDSVGRPENSFQINFNGDYASTVTPLSQSGLTAVVRGDEIHVANTIRIREPDGNGGANSGGWGPVVGSVPFRMVGDTVQFSAPTAELGWTGGGYQYSAFSFDYGSLTVEHDVTMVPTPTAAVAGSVGLIVAAVVGSRMRRRQSSFH